MSIKNWKVTANLLSPLAGDPPNLDAILQYELAARLGLLISKKLTRDVSLSSIESVPIPVAKRTINGVDIFCCSNPVLPKPSAEWVDYASKRIDTHEIALALLPEERKSLLVSSGPFKMRRAPMRIRLVPKITWFIRCARNETNKLLKGVLSLGSRRGIGYGLVSSWEWEEIEEDNSIFAMQHGKQVLMRTLPVGPELDGITGYRRGFGAATPPYWHPESYREIVIPC